ncbi:MAG: glycosyltransferase family 4 protein [Candidatus Paceibacterota bacterium]|jgi:glycosyltransferase involved in cell wall biosynthesis
MIKNVLMIGWEYPPLNSGGLGVACQGLVNSLSAIGINIVFYLPQRITNINQKKGVVFNFIDCAFFKEADKNFLYTYTYLIDSNKGKSVKFYKNGGTLVELVKIYANKLLENTKDYNFDIIHAHDWLTVPAALALREISKKPLILHIHATEFDRAGGIYSLNSEIASIEKEGLIRADKVIAVSQYTKEKIVNLYNILPERIEVVHNGISSENEDVFLNRDKSFFKNKNTVLFVGRLTIQKGVDWFLKAAEKISKINENTVFLIVGDGDYKGKAIELANDMKISDKVIFTGFLRGGELKKAYKLADVFVLPSVSEPFGITALEAIKSGVPVILSNNSGAREIIKGSIGVDFWNTKDMAEKITAVLSYPRLKNKLIEDSKEDLGFATWERAADKIVKIYNNLTHG